MAPLDLHIPIEFEPASDTETEGPEIIQSVIEMLNAPIPEEFISDADSHVESPKIAELYTKIQMAQSAEKDGPRSKIEARKYVNRLSAKLYRERRKQVLQSKQEFAVLEEEQTILKSNLRQTQAENNILRKEVEHWKRLTESVPLEIHAALLYDHWSSVS